MTQRIRDRLTGEGDNLGLDNEILVRAFRTGEWIDQFTTHTPEEAKATLERVPKCLLRVNARKS